MINIMCFKAFDRTLRDIMTNVDGCNNCKPFGGKMVVLEMTLDKFYLSQRKHLGMISLNLQYTILTYGNIVKC